MIETGYLLKLNIRKTSFIIQILEIEFYYQNVKKQIYGSINLLQQ